MKIRNDDRLAYREGRFEEIEPEALAFLEAEEAKAKPVVVAKEEKKEAEKAK